jgi:hypothetical protein
MFRMNVNPGSPAANHRLLGTAPRLQSAPSGTPHRNRSAKVRGRGRDDATFIAIAALVAIFFVTQVGWVVGQQQPHPQINVSRT